MLILLLLTSRQLTILQSPAFTEFIKKTTELPTSQLPQHLSTISTRWPFPRGDLYNWIDVLDRFDDVLQKFNKAYGLSDGPQTKSFGNLLLLQDNPGLDDKQLQALGFANDGDRQLVESILSFSKLLLEKCGNRTLYNSTERLNDLLNTTSLSLLNETLRITLLLAQRYADRPSTTTNQAQFYQFDLERIQKLAGTVPRNTSRRTPQSPTKTTKSRDKSSQTKLRNASNTADPNDFRALARPASAGEPDWSTSATVKLTWPVQAPSAPQSRPAASRLASSDLPSSPTPVRQQTATTSTSNASNIDTNVSHSSSADASGTQHVELTATDIAARPIEDTLQHAPESMPANTRYEFLYKLRIAYGLLDSAESRNLLLQIRLTAICIVCQVYNEDELSSKFFGDTNASARQNLVLQLANLLRDSKQPADVSLLYVQCLAMQALTILPRFRQMSNEIISVLSPNSSHGLMMSLVQRGLTDISQDGDSTDNDIGDDWRDAVFIMGSIVMVQTGPHHARSSEQHVHKSLICAYASALQKTTTKALRIHLRVLDFLKNLFHHFKDGLQVLNANAAFTIACDATYKLSQEALELARDDRGMPREFKNQNTDYKIPYLHQQVLRSLVELVDDISGHQGNHADRALRGFVDSAALLNAFRLILSHMDEFGAHTWSKVVKAVCGFLNNEPTSFTVVSEAGIISTLLSVIQPQSLSTPSVDERQPRKISAVPSEPTVRLPPIADAITNLASAFGAICLTEAGHNQFIASNVLEKFFELFESPEHIKAIKDSNTFLALGSTFDELVRHHPGLKNPVVSSVVTMIARVQYICKSKLKLVGAGPKIWKTDPSDPSVAGGVQALLAEDTPGFPDTTTGLTPLVLPNKDTLEFSSFVTELDPSLATSAKDKDDDGLTALDYARPVVGFLATFFDGRYMCKEVMNAGATDMILDLVTLPTLPVVEDTFSDALHMQELTSVIRTMAEERPYLVLPLLVDHARFICTTALPDFMDYRPDSIQCYFGSYLVTPDASSGMEVDQPNEASLPANGTRLVKGLMSIYCITKVLAEVFLMPTYPARASHNSILAQINIADILAEVISLFGKLSAACCREEISLLSLIPQTWLDATRPGNYSTGDHDVDAILDVSDSTGGDNKDGEPQNDPDSVKEIENTPAFRNLKTLRYLLTETPASIATLFSRIGCCYGGRKKAETILKQKIHLVSDAIAHALTQQLDPPFLSKAFLSNEEERYRDWRFKYFTVVMSRLRDSLWEETTNVPETSIRQSFVVDCFRRADGLSKLTKIGTEFFVELKACQVAKPVFAANVGLKICLELFDDLTHPEIVTSAQAGYMKNTDVTRPYYFNPSQLLLETRMECLKLTRRIWDSDYAEQASNDVIRRLIRVLRHTFEGQHEDQAVQRIEDFPKLKPHERRKFMIDKSKAATLKEKGYDSDLIDEALYRCNVLHSTQVQNAEEYCKALRANPQRRSLPIPVNEVDYKGGSTPAVPQLASSMSVMDTTPGPTTTIFEDSSLDEESMAAQGAPSGEEASTSVSTGPVDARPVTDAATPAGPSTQSTMSINNILNTPQTTSAPEAQSIYTRQSMDNERGVIRDQLPERCNNILSNHPNLTFELNDLLFAAASRLDDDAAQEWWKSTTDLLVSSLISQSLDEELSETQGKKIAATAHLVGLLCSNDSFKPSMLSVIQEHIEAIIGFLQVPAQKPSIEESSPWVAPVLLILEKILALDADPDEVIWSDPMDLDSWTEPRLRHQTIIEHSSKELLFHKLTEILPRVGKDRAMAVSIVRVLVILTRDRTIAQQLGERKNLQKLFLMVKQLAGGVNGRFESAMMIVLRHVIEDEETIKSIMGSEITAYFRSRAAPRSPDFTSYLKELNYLALRSPSLFVAVSNEKVKLTSWSPGQAAASSTLTLRENTTELEPTLVPEATSDSKAFNELPAESVEATTGKKSEDGKSTEVKVPVVQHPDGVVHFLLSELLSYKDVVEDIDPVAGSEDDDTQLNGVANSDDNGTPQTRDQQEKPAKVEKPRFKADDHPIFMYRCFLMHTLTELLYSYNQTKIEFISFSRKADPLAATPSKWRSGVLNYLLNNLVSSNYVDKDESINCKKRVTTSEWATRVLVALCTKTGEKDLGNSIQQRYATPRQIEDNDDEPDLIYVRRFVLEHAIKSFKETLSLPDSTQVRYGRLLCLADLFNKLLAKPAGPEGSVYSNNTSYKRLARQMLEKNLIAVLTAAISDIDLSFPGAKKVIKFILRPLKELTSAAMYLSAHSPESFPQIEDHSPADNISSASSEVSEMDDDREETPDLSRYSALGMLDPTRQGEPDSDESEEDEEMYEDEYDDEDMEFDDEMAAPGNDGEVVSDEELEDAVDVNGPVQGLTGDVPMDIEFVVDHHHHHHHHHHHEGDSEDSSDDDDTEDDDENDDDIEIEIDEDGNMEHGELGHSDEEGDDDGWEDEDGEDINDDDNDDAEDVNFDEEDLHIERADNASAHLNNLLRVLGEPDLDGSGLPPGADVVVQTNDPEDQDDDEDQDEDGDMDDNDGMEYDRFDMMLDGPEDYDENEEWGWEEPPPPVFRRSRHSRAAPMPGFFARRIMSDHEMHHHMLGTRHHRHAPSGRNVVEDGTNPLLQRSDPMAGDSANDAGYSFGRHTPYRRTADAPPPGMPLVLPGGPRGPTYAIPMNAGGADMGGHGAILDAIMGAMQRGDQEFLQNGRIQFNFTPETGGDIRELLRPTMHPARFASRPSREDPQRSAQFVPMLTTSRWSEEARMLFGKHLITKSYPIQRWLMSKLVPLAQEEEKERLRKVEQQRIENERLAKEEEERKAREEEERKVKEAAEAAEQARIEEEARVAAANDSKAEVTAEQAQSGDAMEGVQSSEQALQDPEAASEQPARVYTTIRGRQIDITGLDIDIEYLEALPEDFREEVITQQYQIRREQAQEEGNDNTGIDPDFLDALPEEIREEIRTQEAAAQRRREREQARREAQSSGAPATTGIMDNDDFFATLDPALRRIILAEQPPEILANLNPQHAAEGRAHARSMFFHHRLPMQRELDNAQNRRELLQREAKRQQIVQLIDKAGVATLLRLMFLHQQGSLKINLLNILSHICQNRQTRYEVVSLLLVILKEGSVDVTAVERSLASLSIRAKASGAQKTPQPLKRTLSMQPYGGISEDVTPVLVVQQCLNTLSHICRQNGHVKSLFLREVDVTSGNKTKARAKGKGKESKVTTHPVNDLISLLDRGLIMNNSGCLASLAQLLATVTSPLAMLMRQEKERQDAEKEKAKEATAIEDESEKPNADQPTTGQGDVTMEDVPAPSTQPETEQVAEATDDKPEGTKDDTDVSKPVEQEKKKPFEPPTITDHNLKLITSIFIAPECSNETFNQTLDTLQSLSHIPEASLRFGKELTKHVHALSQSICADLEDLLPAIRDAQSSTDVQGVAAAKFSASNSDQVKLLRVLQALDYLSAPKKDEENSTADAIPASVLTLSYDSLSLGALWHKLSECLTLVEEKGDTISFANILLPLIESLMVVCKHTTLKDAPLSQQVAEGGVTSSLDGKEDDLEELFFKFTSEHRKILNDIVRQSPKLMQGHFSILVKNSKVLDFDNKRNYFNKQIHSRHHAQRHPQPPLQLNVRRDQVFIDSYKALYYKNADEMKYGKLNIRFNGEEGVDAGGVTREWFQVLARGMFDPNYALWQPVASDRTTFHPSSLSRVNPEHLMYFKFIGRIIGKALHEGRVLDCHFSRAVYKRILGKSPNLKDLESNDMDYYKSLCWILENDITDIISEEFCVIEDEFGEEKIIDLIPDGRNISVTEDNKKEYVQRLVEYRLTDSVKEQLDSFLGGFHDIIPAELIAIFNEQELELLISGLPEIDVDDWKANTEYHNYNPSSQQIVWFWRIVKAMTNEERAKLLQFITGTSKVPLNGFKELEGVSGLTKCNIHKDPSTNRLPTSHTCFNQLDLPAYENFELMKHNITTAISLGADYFGFA